MTKDSRKTLRIKN